MAAPCGNLVILGLGLIGGSLARVTHGIIAEIGTAMLSSGDFSGLGRAMPGGEVDKMLKAGAA